MPLSGLIMVTSRDVPQEQAPSVRSQAVIYLPFRLGTCEGYQPSLLSLLAIRNIGICVLLAARKRRR